MYIENVFLNEVLTQKPEKKKKFHHKSNILETKSFQGICLKWLLQDSLDERFEEWEITKFYT